jgi:hypothetical protein
VDTVDATAARRARSWKIVATVALLALILSGGLILKWTREFWNNTDAALVVDPQYLDFGDVWAQPDFRWTLPIRNTTGRDIRVDGFQVSCKCTSIEPESLVVPARGEASVSLAIDLTGAVASEPLGKARDLSLHLAPVVEGGPPISASWTLKGRVRKALEVAPRAVFFQSWELGTAGAAYVATVDLSAVEPLAQLRVDGNDYGHSVEVRQADEEGRRFEISLSLSPAFQRTDFHHRLTITGIAKSGKLLPPFALSVYGTTVPEIYAEPPDLLLGAIPLGESLVGTICLKSASGTPVQLVDVPIPSSETEVSPLAEPPDAGVIRIRQTAVRPGSQIVDIEILAACRGDSPPVRVPVRLVYYGLTASRNPP